MSRFDNKICPICRKPLSEASDVVVCPVCGTPHHRACYLAQNRCGVEEYHSTGFEWHGYLPWEQQAHENNAEESNRNTYNTDEFEQQHNAEYPGGQSGQGDQQQFGGTLDLDELLNLSLLHI